MISLRPDWTHIHHRLLPSHALGIDFVVLPMRANEAHVGFVGIAFAAATRLLIISIVDHTFKIIDVFDVIGSLMGGWLVLTGSRRYRAKPKPTS